MKKSHESPAEPPKILSQDPTVQQIYDEKERPTLEQAKRQVPALKVSNTKGTVLIVNEENDVR